MYEFSGNTCSYVFEKYFKNLNLKKKLFWHGKLLSRAVISKFDEKQSHYNWRKMHKNAIKNERKLLGFFLFLLWTRNFLNIFLQIYCMVKEQLYNKNNESLCSLCLFKLNVTLNCFFAHFVAVKLFLFCEMARLATFFDQFQKLSKTTEISKRHGFFLISVKFSKIWDPFFAGDCSDLWRSFCTVVLF